MARRSSLPQCEKVSATIACLQEVESLVAMCRVPDKAWLTSATRELCRPRKTTPSCYLPSLALFDAGTPKQA